MAENITIAPASGTWVIRAAGAVLGETKNALQLSEDGHDPVIYFPRADISMAFFEASDTQTTCPHKGTAQHYDIVAKSGTITDAAWSYEDPQGDVAQIAGHLAFYKDKVAVEQL